MIGLYAGLRREEILGLKWDCVRLDKTPCIEVRRALRFEHNRPVVSDRLKTKASRRVVPIPPQLVQALHEAQLTSASEFVIHNSENGPLSETQFRHVWNHVVRRTAKDRVYYRYVDGVKIAHHVEAKLGGKARHGGITYTIDFEVTPHILRHTYIHLSHYVRDYRNFIHPAKEIRSTDHISQENILIMWSILKRLINELL